MRLWGKVARGMCVVIGVIFAVVAVLNPEERNEAAAAAVLMMVVGLFGVPLVVRFFSSFTGDEDVLEHGTPGSATITALEWTRWRYGRTHPIVRFALSVDLGGVRYPVTIKQAVDPELFPRLTPGAVLAVRVDATKRDKVVIDWREPVRGLADAGADHGGDDGARTTGRSEPRGWRAWSPFLRWLFLVFGLIFLRLGCEGGYFEKGGVRVEGVVLEKTYSPGTPTTSPSRTSASRSSVRYRFTTKDGRTLEGRADVLRSTLGRLEVGGPVTVEYLENSPETNRIPGQLAGSTTWAVMSFVLLGASAALFIAGRFARRRKAPT